jgi:hypothetical protein
MAAIVERTWPVHNRVNLAHFVAQKFVWIYSCSSLCLRVLVVSSSLRIRRIRVIRGYCFSAISGSGLLRPFRAFEVN